jgi:hypothetical protein
MESFLNTHCYEKENSFGISHHYGIIDNIPDICRICLYSTIQGCNDSYMCPVLLWIFCFLYILFNIQRTKIMKYTITALISFILLVFLIGMVFNLIPMTTAVLNVVLILVLVGSFFHILIEYEQIKNN